MKAFGFFDALIPERPGSSAPELFTRLVGVAKSQMSAMRRMGKPVSIIFCLARRHGCNQTSLYHYVERSVIAVHDTAWRCVLLMLLHIAVTISIHLKTGSWSTNLPGPSQSIVNVDAGIVHGI